MRFFSAYKAGKKAVPIARHKLGDAKYLVSIEECYTLEAASVSRGRVNGISSKDNPAEASGRLPPGAALQAAG